VTEIYDITRKLGEPWLVERPALMFAVKGFEQASTFWFSPGAVILDGVHGRGQD
jgi:hypothetical protein